MEINKSWFEFNDVINKNVTETVWIPLWYHQSTKSAVEMPEIGYWEDYVFTRAIMVDELDREDLMEEECYRFNPCHGNESHRWRKDYYRANFYYDHNVPIGEFLVLRQEYGQKAVPEVRINQDIIFALGLKEENDNWIRPDEGYDVVIRQARNNDGEIFKVEILQKYLKDYLCAVGKGVVFVSYRERTMILGGVPDFGWNRERDEEREFAPHVRWCGYVQAMDDNGDVGLGEWSVMTSGYKDIRDDDVPRFDPLGESNEMYVENYETKANPVSRYKVVGELHKKEWIGPAGISVRASDDKAESLDFFAAADGSLKNGRELSYPPQWLWFENDVMNRIVKVRGSNFGWYSAQTGFVAINADWPIDFGINKLGLVNVLAKDIVKLPYWQQEMWKGCNVTPDGGVSEELQMAQMQCRPAKTHSAEDAFFKSLEKLHKNYKFATNGTPLYKEAIPSDKMKSSIHRFVVQKHDDVFLLAKNIIRYTCESFNVGPLWPLVKKSDEDKKLGSLKMLERFLAKQVDESTAHDTMSPLFYLYDLRLVDAHPKPREDVDEAMGKLGITSDMSPIHVGELVINQVATTFDRMSRILYGGFATHSNDGGNQ